MIEYVYLTNNDIDTIKLSEFFKQSETPENASKWMLEGLSSKSSDIVIVAELVNGTINGIVCGCTISYWVKASTNFLPIWLAIRMDRLNLAPTRFSSFITQSTRMLSAFFEKKKIFQHYIVRRLPKKDMDMPKLQEVVNKSWGFHPYVATVEDVIKSQEDFDKSFNLFKTMINTYRSPVVVLSLNLENTTREERLCNNYGI